VDWAIYGALIAASLAVAGAAALLALRLLEGWRTLRRTRRHLARGLAALADSAGRTSDIAARASDQGELEASLARLRVALARLNVLRASVDEVGDSFRVATGLYPRK
jgi:hypothetical protein